MVKETRLAVTITGNAEGRVQGGRVGHRESPGEFSQVVDFDNKAEADAGGAQESGEDGCGAVELAGAEQRPGPERSLPLQKDHAELDDLQ